MLLKQAHSGTTFKSLATGIAWALNRMVQHSSYTGWAGPPWSFCLSLCRSHYGIARHGMCHPSVDHPRQVDDHRSHSSVTTDNAMVNTLENGFTHSPFGSISCFSLGKVTFSFVFHLLLWPPWCSDIWYFVHKQICKQTQGPSAGQAYQLSFPGLASLTQLPQPDELPSCGQSSVL